MLGVFDSKNLQSSASALIDVWEKISVDKIIYFDFLDGRGS